MRQLRKTRGEELPTKKLKPKKKNYFKKEMPSFLDEFEPDQEGFTVEAKSNKTDGPMLKSSLKTDIGPKRKIEKNQKSTIKTRNKWGTNGEQTGNKTRNKLGTNREQTGNKTRNKKEQKSRNGEQTRVRMGNKTGNKLGTNWEQTRNKSSGFGTLTGLQKKLTKIIFNHCLKRASNITPPIAISHLAQSLNSPIPSVKVTVRRLVKKNIISKHKFKIGRGGWTQYHIKKEVYDELLIMETGNKLETNWEQMGNKLGSEWGSEWGTNGPSSSSYIDIKETTTTQTNEKSQLNGVIIPESLAAIGMTENHLSQVWAKYPHAIPNLQRSLEALAYDIDCAGGIETFKQQNKINNLFGWFFGAIKAGGYESKNDGFLTDEERGEIETLERLKKQKKNGILESRNLRNLCLTSGLPRKRKKK